MVNYTPPHLRESAAEPRMLLSLAHVHQLISASQELVETLDSQRDDFVKELDRQREELINNHDKEREETINKLDKEREEMIKEFDVNHNLNQRVAVTLREGFFDLRTYVFRSPQSNLDFYKSSL
ncbi:Nn.00g012170.m01.CDS01 [Neocucurbitaria sp. VM-36]